MILVLGAGGTVGRHLLAELDARGLDYRAAFHSADKLERALDQGLDAVAVDLARPRSLQAALEDIDRVFLLSAATPQLAEQECAAIEAFRQAGVGRVVKVSVWDADMEGYSFARWHRPAELALADSGIEHVILRPNGYMQSLAAAILPTVRDHGSLYLPGAHHACAYVDAHDIARCAATLLADAPSAPEATVWNLSGPQALDAAGVAEALGAVLRKPVRAVDIGLEAYAEALTTAGLPAWMVEALVDLAAYQADASFCRVTDDVETVSGRPPRVLADYFADIRDDFIA